MNMLVRATWLALVCCAAAVQAQESIPSALRDWQGWVLRGEEYRACPFLSSAAVLGQPVEESAYRCVWPERLSLSVDARGGTFTQRWQVYAESWVYLPGDSEFWPRDVRLNGAPAAVVATNDVPSVRLAPGSYTLTGRFEWSTRPEALPVPARTAIVDLTVDGQRVAQPERPGGDVWLGKRRSVEQAADIEVQVYRLLADAIPARLVTRVRLNVAGDAREELLARVLPEGYVPMSIEGSLPARLEPDGRLRVQVHAGAHDVIVNARGPDVAGTLARPATGDDRWARDEIWSFAANDALRVAAAEGAEGIDPAQANVPHEWRQFPAFRLGAGDKLSVVERSRGLANVDDNRLALGRSLWLDFDHDGFTAVDNIQGTMRRDWRLDMLAPFQLASARRAARVLPPLGDQQLRAVDARAGVELRQPQVRLTTIARQTSPGGAMPATGWDSRFDQVNGVLHLPPGHRLLAVTGADFAPGSWWERWGLWNVFGVLIVLVFVYWTAGRVPAAIAALALLLTYQDAPAYIWLWGNLLAALAIARAAPEGRFQRIARAYRTVSFVVLGLALLPFLWLQVRYALYPQLEKSFAYSAALPQEESAPVENPYGLAALHEPSLLDQAADAVAGAVAPAAPAPVPPPIEADIVEERRNLMSAPAERTKRFSGLNSQLVVQRYAAGTVLQAGPGIPAWRYNSYRYGWTGPVEAGDTVRFIYLGPVSMFFWRLAGVIALGVLFVWLALLSFGSRWRPPGLRAPAGTAAALAVLALGALGTPVPAGAQEPAPPPSELLQELKARLTAPPRCTPHCAEIAQARVVAEGDRLEVTLQVSALAQVAVAMPHAGDQWQLDEVSVDARASLAVSREDDASLWVPLSPGAHTVRLAGRIATADAVSLVFRQAPRAISVSTRGWVASGVNDGRLVGGGLELSRDRAAGAAAATGSRAGSDFPAFVHVDRVFNLDLDWTLSTQVRRLAPERAPILTSVPLVPGESVQTPGVEVRNGAALIGLGAGEAQFQWESGLARANTLELEMPAGAPRSESWSFVVNPQWNVSFEGFPAVMPEDEHAPLWVFRFLPRPGEKLKVTLTRPEPVGGTTLAIDQATQHTTIGKRSSVTQLGFSYRSTQGGRHVIVLPETARVTAVRLDGAPVQLRPEKGELPLSLTPGAHRVEVSWEESRDAGFRSHPSAVDLRSPASNIRYTLVLPESRWPLFASGPGVGPALLYWGELVVFVAVAWLLGRWSRSPLRFAEWLLLGLGLSTQSWFVFALTAAWLFVMRWREQYVPAPDLKAWRFNALQVLLAAFTVIALFALVFSGIRNGLLAAPDMGVAGPGSYGGTFSWFQDHTEGKLDGPTIWSAPMWVYRALFFAWASWMAFALVRWLRWAFGAWKSGGLWK